MKVIYRFTPIILAFVVLAVLVLINRESPDTDSALSDPGEHIEQKVFEGIKTGVTVTTPDAPVARNYEDRFLAGAIELDRRVGQAGPEGVYTIERLIEVSDFKVPVLRVVEDVTGEGDSALVRRRVVSAADRILVQFSRSVSDKEVQAVANVVDSVVERALRMEGCYIFKKQGVADLDTVPWLLDTALAIGEDESKILLAEEELVFFALGFPNDPRFNEQWGLHNIGQSGGTSDADIDGPAGWDIATQAEGMPVAVIDTGVDFDHPDLQDNIYSNPNEVLNGVDDDENGYIDDVWGWDFYANDNNPDDASDHGTHAAGIIGARGNNGIGISGTAWSARIASLRFMSSAGTGVLSDALDAIYYSNREGFRISSNSWGGEGYSNLLYQAIQGTLSVDAVFIAAAGNDSKDMDTYPIYPAAFDVPSIISVTATDRRDELAEFSNFGVSSVDLAAPGVAILSTEPYGLYGYQSGTSMAAPFVTGAVALLREASPDLDAAGVKEALIQSADLIDSLDGKVAHGRLNLAALLIGNAGAYPQIKNIRVVDSVSEGGIGNGDGIASPGETLALYLEVENIGSESIVQLNISSEFSDSVSGVTLLQGESDFWNVDPGSTVEGNQPIKISISNAVPTPNAFELKFTLRSETGKEWITSQKFFINRVFSITGTVVADSTGAGLENARILDTATEELVGQTDGSGNFSINLIDGSYSLQATASGFLPSEIVQLNMPPAPAGPIHFRLGRSEMEVSPLSIAATINQGQSALHNITVSNSGNRDLEYSIQKLYRVNSGAQAAVSGNTVNLIEGFEAGSLDNWTLVSSSTVANLSTFSKVEGESSLQLTSRFYDSHRTGVYRDLPEDAQPSNIRFSVRPGSTIEDDAYFVLMDRSGDSEIIRFHAADDGMFKLNESESVQTNYPYEARRWYTIEFRNIDWATGVLDFYVDDNVVALDVPLLQQVAGQGGDRIHLYNYTTDSESWWDNLTIGEGNESWIHLLPQSGVVQAGGSDTIEVTLATGGLSAGNYLADLIFYSNVPGQSETVVPVSLTVVELPNNAPVAEAFSINIVEDEVSQFKLRASDPDGDKLVAKIETLPGTGTLYQVLADGSIGPEMSVNGTLVMHSEMELIYIPPEHGFGSPLATFSYTVSDGKVKSAEVVVTINVSEVNDAPIARDDYFDTASGESPQVVPVLANDSDADGDGLQIVSVGSPGKGVASNNGDGTISYTPNADFVNGMDSFEYSIVDGRGGASEANVIVRRGSAIGGSWPTLGGNAQHTGEYPTALGDGQFVEVWNTASFFQWNQPLVVSNRVYTSPNYNPQQRSAQAWDLSTGVLLWENPMLGVDDPYTINPPTYFDGRIFVQNSVDTGESQLWCMDAATGETVWNASTPRTRRKYLSPVVDNNGIYIYGGDSNELYRFNHDGSQQFIADHVGDGSDTAPVLDNAGNIYSWTWGDLRQHNPVTGVDNWMIEVGDQQTGVVFGNLLLGHASNILYAINLDTHQIEWQQSGTFNGLPAVSNGVIYVYSRSSYKTVVNAHSLVDGSLIRSYLMDSQDTVHVDLQPIVTQDKLIATHDSLTRVFDLNTAEVLQEFPYGGRIALGSGYLVLAVTDRSNYDKKQLIAYRFSSVNETLPQSNSQSFRGVEDNPLALTLSGSDGDGLPVYPVVSKLPLRGTLYQTRDGSTPGDLIQRVPTVVHDRQGRLIYVPEKDGFGDDFDSIEFKVSNGYSLSGVPGTVTIHLDPVPDAPVAIDDVVYSMPGHSLPAIDVRLNDYDVDNDMLEVQSVGDAEYGTLSLNPDGSISYAPDKSVAQGNEAVQYTISDGTGLTDTAILEIRVGPYMGEDWPMLGGNPEHDGFLPVSLPSTGWYKSWAVPISSHGKPVSIADGKVFLSAINYGNRPITAAFDLISGGELWRNDFPEYENIAELSPPAYYNGKVYLQRNYNIFDTQMWCLDADSGEPIWDTPMVSYYPTYKPVTIADGKVWMEGGERGGLYGFDAETGEELFFHELYNEFQWTPAYANGAVYEVVNGLFQAHHPETGEVLWSIYLDPSVEHGNAGQVILKGNRAIASTHRGLYCINLDSRTIAWTATDRGYDTYHYPAVTDGSIYVGLYNVIREHNLYTGELMAEFESGIERKLSAQYIVTSNLLIASNDYETFIFDRKTRELKQTLYEGGEISLGGNHLIINSPVSNSLIAYTVASGSAPENFKPVAQDAEMHINEDSRVVVQLEGVDQDGDRLLTVISSLPDKGRLYQTIDGIQPSEEITSFPVVVTNDQSKVIFEPIANDHGMPYTSFSFRVQDGIAVSDPGTATINVAPVNDPPTAVSDYITVRPSTASIPIVPGANDIDLDGDILKVIDFTQPSIGQLERIDDQTLQYVRDPGLDSYETSFTYTIIDAGGVLSTSTVYLVIDARVGMDWPAYGGNLQHTQYQPVNLGDGPWLKGIEVDIGEPLSDICLVDGIGYVTHVENGSKFHVKAVEISSGRTIWNSTRDLSNSSDDANGILHYDGKLYVQTSDRADASLWCLDAQTGETIWTSPVLNQSRLRIPAVADESGIYLQSGSYGNLLGFNFDGSRKFQVSVSTEYWWTPTIDTNGKLYTWDETKLTEHDKATGEALWTHTVDPPDTSAHRSAVVISDGVAYLKGSGKLTAYRLSTRTLIWEMETGVDIIPAVAKNRVFAINRPEPKVNQFEIAILDAVDGRIVQRIDIGNSTPSYPLVVTNEFVIMGKSYETFVYDRFSGTLLETFPYGGNVIVANDLICISSQGRIVTFGKPPPGSHSPVATGVHVSGQEDTNLQIQLTATDADGDSLSYFVTTQPLNGTLYQTSDGVTPGLLIETFPALIEHPEGRLIYVPYQNGNGVNYGDFKFIAKDAFTSSNEEDVQVDIAPVDDPVVGITDVIPVSPGGIVDPMYLLSNDYDVDGDPLSIISFTQPSIGTVSETASGELSYQAPVDVVPGNTSFTYSLSDSVGPAVEVVVIVRIEESFEKDWTGHGGGMDHTGSVRVSLDTASWGKTWSSTRFSDDILPLTIANGIIYAVPDIYYSNARFFGLSVETGEIIWVQDFGTVYGMNPLAWYDGRVYIQLSDSRTSSLRCLDALTGNQIWQVEYTDSTDWHYAPVVNNNGVWINASEGIYGFNLDGIQRFYQLLERCDGWTPAIGPDGKIYSWTGGVFRCHDPVTGDVLWSLTPDQTTNAGSMSTAPVISGNIAYVKFNAVLYCIDLAGQSLKWSKGGNFIGTPAVSAGVVYALEQGSVKAFLGDSGNDQFTYKSPSDVPLVGQPLITYNRIFASDGELTYVWDRQSGQLVQTIPDGGNLAMVDQALFITSDRFVVRYDILDEITVNPQGGVFEDPLNVQVSSSVPGMVVYFTTNGSEPNTNSRQIGEGDYLTVDQSTTLKLIGKYPDGSFTELYQFDYLMRDEDNDRLPDWWESNYYGSISLVTADSDTDNDGFSAENEFQFGTNPKSDKSHIEVVVENLPEGSHIIKWEGYPIRSYRIYGSENLNTWQLVMDNITGVEGPVEITVSQPSLKFFRVFVY